MNLVISIIKKHKNSLAIVFSVQIVSVKFTMQFSEFAIYTNRRSTNKMLTLNTIKQNFSCGHKRNTLV